MYPTLTDFIKEVFGLNIPLPIQTYGLMVALAFLSAGYLMMLEIKRKVKEGVIVLTKKKVLVGAPLKPSVMIISIFVGFLLGFKLGGAMTDYSTFVDDPAAFVLSGKGNFFFGILIAALSGFLTWRDNKKQLLSTPKWEEIEQTPKDISGNLLVVAAVFGLLGAKIFHNLENIEDLMKDPINSIFSFSGLTFFGGLILGGIAMLRYASMNGIKPARLLEICAPAIAMGYCVGRLGCHISGDGCWGIVNNLPKPSWMSFMPDWMWSYDYPHNVVNEGIEILDCHGKHCRVLPKGVFPTSLWEAMSAFLMFAILWPIRKIVKVPGMLFYFYLIMAGIERFFIERIRVNNEYNVLGSGITQAEIISVVIFGLGVFGVAYSLYLWKKKAKLVQNEY